jgi:hypothetical protein
MKKIELLWNIVYYFVYKRYNGMFMSYALTYKPLFFQDIKFNRAMVVMLVLGILFTLSLVLVFSGIFASGFHVIFAFIPTIMSFFFNYYVLFRNDKCTAYFKEFETQPSRWKRKWSWISFGFIIAIILLLGASIKFMDYSLHRRGVSPGNQ